MRDKISTFIKSDTYFYIIAGVIILNATLIGFHTMLPPRTELWYTLDSIEHLFIMALLIEVLFRVFILRGEFFRDGWNVFDFVVTSFSTITHFRSLSLLRLFRVLVKIPNMEVILVSLRSIAGQVAAILLVVSIMFYIFGVIGVRLYGETAPESFSDLRWSMISLSQIMVGDDYGDIFKNIIKGNISGYFYFIFVTLAFTFILVNLFIGVVVGAIKSAVDKSISMESSEEIKYLNQVIERLDRLERKLEKHVGEKSGK